MKDPFTPSPELAAIATRWIRTYSGRDAIGVENLFSRSNAVTYIGSDENEFFTGDEVRAVIGAFTDDQAVLIAEDITATGYEAGAFGWACTTLTIHSPEANLRVKFRNTFVFSMENAIWRIVHIHNSNPKPNMEAMGYVAPDLDKLIEASRDRINVGNTGIASVMFTDIVDSTALASATGDAKWSRIVTDHVAGIARAVENAGGTLVKSLGDGTLSTFSSASAAMTVAREIMQAAAANTSEPHLRLRIGIHTGDVVEAEGDFLGTVVNKAARVAAAAGPDEIRVTDATRAMIGGQADFAFSDAGNVPLKGLEGEHMIFRLDWRP